MFLQISHKCLSVHYLKCMRLKIGMEKHQTFSAYSLFEQPKGSMLLCYRQCRSCHHPDHDHSGLVSGVYRENFFQILLPLPTGHLLQHLQHICIIFTITPFHDTVLEIDG